MLTQVRQRLRTDDDRPFEFLCCALSLPMECQEIAEILEDEIAALATGHPSLVLAAA